MNLPTKWTSLFLIAPAGWGKTSLILKLYEQNTWNILYISPLKSLEQEVENRFSEIETKKNFCQVLTAEKVPKFLDKLKHKEIQNLLVVIDEVHLWNFWGDTFRERLWECFFSVGEKGIPILGITATLKEVYYKSWQDLFAFGGYEFDLLDLGNGKLFFEPNKEISYYGLKNDQFFRRVLSEVDKGERCLIFCHFKNEVIGLCRKLTLAGINAKYCVGGKSIEFLEECKREGEPQVIVSTTVLSHGVNLGKIKKVFISYEVSDWDLYLQMKARGGRDGKGFEVFCVQKESSSHWNRIRLRFFDRYLSLFYA